MFSSLIGVEWLSPVSLWHVGPLETDILEDIADEHAPPPDCRAVPFAEQRATDALARVGR